MASIAFLLGLKSKKSAKAADNAAGDTERSRRSTNSLGRSFIRSRSDPGKPEQAVPFRTRSGFTLPRTPEEASVHHQEHARQAPPIRRPLGSGAQIVNLSEFTVEEQVGEGTFGRVYTATWKHSGKAVAIKAVKKKEEFQNTVPDEELPEFYRAILDSFKNEFKFLAIAGAHPNIVSCLGKSKDQQAAVMEMACCDLFQLVKASKKQLPLDICHHISGGLLAGVVHLHNQGIIHQDLKSSNILLDAHGHPKICDFGLAIVVRKGQDVQVDRELVTAWYRAPELLLGADQYGSQIDNWAVGCIILEMLLGQVPFPGNPKMKCRCDHRRHLNFNADQLTHIFRTVGTPEISPKVYHCAAHCAGWPRYQPLLPQLIATSIQNRPTSPIDSAPSGPDYANVEAWTEVVEDLLNCDPEQRLTCGEALQFPIFRASHSSDSLRTRSPVRPTSSSVSPGRKIRPGTGSLRRMESEVVPTPRGADELLQHLTEKRNKTANAAVKDPAGTELLRTGSAKGRPDAGSRLNLKFPSIGGQTAGFERLAIDSARASPEDMIIAAVSARTRK